MIREDILERYVNTEGATIEKDYAEMTPAEKASIMRGGKLSGIAEIQEGLGQVRPGMKKGGGTEVGKEATSYKEYVKKMFGGGMTEPTIKKNKDQ